MAENKRSKHGRKLKFTSDEIHAKVDRDSDDNAGVDAANRGTQAAEYAGDFTSNTISRINQKRGIKREYAAAKAGQSAGNAAASGDAAAGGAKEAKKAVKEGKSVTDRFVGYVAEHGRILLAGGWLLLIILMITGAFGSCTAFLDGSANAVLVTSYTADDADILGAEADYCALEASLQNRINNIQSTHPGYDEYNIDSDQIGHNPYELASYLTVLFENYSREEVQNTLQQIFSSQYDLSINPVTETRYRTETRTKTKIVTKTVTDPETGETHEIEVEKEIEYEVEVPYQYKILNVTLNNNGLSSILTSGNLSEDQLFRYGVLMETLGNRSDLFGDNKLIETCTPNMLTELEKQELIRYSVKKHMDSLSVSKSQEPEERTSSYNEMLKKAYSGFNQGLIGKVFRGGLEQADIVLRSLAKIYGKDLNELDEVQYNKILKSYTDVYIRKKLVQCTDEHTITSLQVLHPEFVTDKDIARRVLAYVLLNIINNDASISDEKIAEQVDLMAENYAQMEETAKLNAAVEDAFLDDPEYGLVPEKPIYTQGVTGSNRYLDSLRSASGEELTWTRTHTTTSPEVIGIIDVYEGKLPSGKLYNTLYLNMYGSKISTAVPQGFTCAEHGTPKEEQ